MTKDINLGKNIRILRKERKLTKARLAEEVGISESHMDKIEAGSRKPGIITYQRIMGILGADMVFRDIEDTVKGKCIKRAEKILWESTDKQALYLIKMLEYMSANFEIIS